MSNLSFASEISERDDTIETVYKLGIASLFILVATFVFNQKTHKLPIINQRKWYEFGTDKAVKRFNTNATSLIRAGLEKVLAKISHQDMKNALNHKPCTKPDPNRLLLVCGQQISDDTGAKVCEHYPQRCANELSMVDI